MPILHRQVSLETQDGQGNKKSLDPKVSLLVRGPVFQVTLQFPENISQQLIQEGKPVPNPVSGWALIDTGASSTSIDDAAAQKLGLPVIDRGKLTSATHAEVECNIYPAQISFTGTPIKVNVQRAIGTNLVTQDLIALLGRDLLQHFTIFYNGAIGQVTISF